mgnify:CR=1 FL=1
MIWRIDKKQLITCIQITFSATLEQTMFQDPTLDLYQQDNYVFTAYMYTFIVLEIEIK